MPILEELLPIEENELLTEIILGLYNMSALYQEF